MKKILSLIIVTALMLSLTACGDKEDKNNVENNTENNSTQTEQVQNNNNVTLNDSIYLEADVLGEALGEHDFLNNNFTFEKDYNQLIEAYAEDTSKYIANETWIWNGVPNKGTSKYSIEGEKASYSLSMQRIIGTDYPSNIGITILCSNSIDFENMISWSHELIGSCLPPKLAKAFQNASFEGLTENTYSVGKIETSVYKNTSYNEDGTILCEMNIMIKEANEDEEVKFSDLSKFISDKGSTLGIYKLDPFDAGSSVINMETRLADIFDKDVEAKLMMLSTYDSKGIERNATSTYAVFALQSVGNAEISIIADSSEELVSGDKTETVIIEGQTLPYVSKEKAYESAERIVEGLFGCEADFSELINTEAGGEVTLTDNENDTYGFPVLVSLHLVTNTDDSYTISFSVNAVPAEEELKIIEQ